MHYSAPACGTICSTWVGLRIVSHTPFERKYIRPLTSNAFVLSFVPFRRIPSIHPCPNGTGTVFLFLNPLPYMYQCLPTLHYRLRTVGQWCSKHKFMLIYFTQSWQYNGGPGSKAEVWYIWEFIHRTIRQLLNRNLHHNEMLLQCDPIWNYANERVNNK